MSIWIKYCTEQYNHPVTGDTAVLNVINENKEMDTVIRHHPIKESKSEIVSELPNHQALSAI